MCAYVCGACVSALWRVNLVVYLDFVDAVSTVLLNVGEEPLSLVHLGVSNGSDATFLPCYLYPCYCLPQ